MSWHALAAKELREQLRPAGRYSGNLMASFGLAVVFGIGGTLLAAFVFLDASPATSTWARAAMAVLTGAIGAAFAGALLPLNSGVDAIAGERERHTLETLLAGPLGDLGLFWGKTAAILAIAMLVGATGTLAVLVTAGVLFGLPGIAWGVLALIATPLALLLPAFVLCCWAFVFSLRAKTVKDAAQKTAFLVMPLVFLPQVVLAVAGGAQPTTRAMLIGAMFLFFAAITVLGPLLAMTRFRRERLIT